MLIESFAPSPDALEHHRVEIAAPGEAVYRALWTSDLTRSPVVRGLLTLRSLPGALGPATRRRWPRRPLTLPALVEAGFGIVAEEPGREVVLGVVGRFWRPTGNIQPFNREVFGRPAPAGMALAVWNFAVHEIGPGRTILSTETRVVCGDAASRRKFRAYWLVVRPFSGLIRMILLRAVRQACERPSADRT